MVLVEAARVAVAAAAVVVTAVAATGLDGRGLQVLCLACFLVVAASVWGVAVEAGGAAAAAAVAAKVCLCISGCVGVFWLLSCCPNGAVVVMLWCFGEGSAGASKSRVEAVYPGCN